MKRMQITVACAVAGAALITTGVLAQKSAPRDLAALVQAGESKLALEQINSGADVNKAQPDGTTPLIWAANRSENEVAEALIAKKADVNAVNEFGSMPLTEAARKSNARLVKALLAAGAKVDSANPDGETALMMAISGGELSVVEALVNAGANVNNIEKFHNQTPLMYASASTRNSGAIVKMLIAKGAKVDVRSLYSDWPSQVTSEPRTQYRSVGGLTALLYASRSGCYDCAEALIAAGADLNLPTPEGMTPLINALDNEHNDIAKLLIEKGADVNLWDWWGRTALWVAVDRKTPPNGPTGFAGFGGGGGGGGRAGAPGGRGGRGGAAPAASNRPPVSSMDIIKTLLAMGVNPNPEMNFHRPNAPGRGRFGDNQVSTNTTALFRAVQNNDPEVVQVLLEKGADPNINSMGYTAFLMAAGAGPGGRGAQTSPNMPITDLLVQHGADVNAKVTGTASWSFNVSRENMGNKDTLTKEGTTALHEAARSVNPDMVKYLLAHGANPNLLDAAGKKPIDMLGIQRAARGGNTPGIGQQANGQPGVGGRGAARGPSPAAASEVRTLLEAAMWQ